MVCFNFIKSRIMEISMAKIYNWEPLICYKAHTSKENIFINSVWRGLGASLVVLKVKEVEEWKSSCIRLWRLYSNSPQEANGFVSIFFFCFHMECKLDFWFDIENIIKYFSKASENMQQYLGFCLINHDRVFSP